MNGPLSGKTRRPETRLPGAVEDAPVFSLGHSLPGPHFPRDFADRLFAHEAFAHETLNPTIKLTHTAQGTEPYSLQWFLNIESQRHGRQGRWIPRILEFAKHSGETLLGLGNGLGTDWLQYARHGASVLVCSPSADQLSLIRRNFELRGLPGRFLHSTPQALPLGNASIDVACVSGLLHEVDDPRAVVREIYRVLKPGGKVLAVGPARYDVDFWKRTAFPWRRLIGRGNADESVRARYFSARRLRRLFDPFIEHRVYKRQLRRGEVPYGWRWVPLPLLERMMGHVLILKSFKPLSAALPVAAAA